jgi:hypothetical protein
MELDAATWIIDILPFNFCGAVGSGSLDRRIRAIGRFNQIVSPNDVHDFPLS